MDEQDDRFDVVVLGAGLGGYVTAIRAAQLGKRVAVAERTNGGIGSTSQFCSCVTVTTTRICPPFPSDAFCGVTLAESFKVPLIMRVRGSRGVRGTRVGPSRMQRNAGERWAVSKSDCRSAGGRGCRRPCGCWNSVN